MPEVQRLTERAASPGATAGQPAAGAAPEEHAAESARPEWVPEAHWNAEANALNLETFGQHYGELTALEKAQAERKAALPKDAAGYALTLPDDFQFPDGLTRENFSVAEDDPFLGEFRQLMFDREVAPDVVQDLYSLKLKIDAAQIAMVNKRLDEENKKLGANFAARRQAIKTFAESRLGKELAEAISAVSYSANFVKAIETFQSQFTTQGASSVDAKPHDPPSDRLSDEQYEQMSPRERLDYARQASRAA